MLTCHDRRSRADQEASSVVSNHGEEHYDYNNEQLLYKAEKENSKQANLATAYGSLLHEKCQWISSDWCRYTQRRERGQA